MDTHSALEHLRAQTSAVLHEKINLYHLILDLFKFYQKYDKKLKICKSFPVPGNIPQSCWCENISDKVVEYQYTQLICLWNKIDPIQQAITEVPYANIRARYESCKLLIQHISKIKRSPLAMETILSVEVIPDTETRYKLFVVAHWCEIYEEMLTDLKFALSRLIDLGVEHIESPTNKQMFKWEVQEAAEAELSFIDRFLWPLTLSC